MRVIGVDDDPGYGVALGSVLVSLLEPAPGQARAFNRWYERDHFYAGCMSGPHFFAGRRFVAPRALKALRAPASSDAVRDGSKGSFLALYWIERGHHQAAERWAVDRVLWLGQNGRMAGGGAREVVHACFYDHRFAACRHDDGVPPEVALDHDFAGVVLLLCERPDGVPREARERWLADTELPGMLAPGSDAALALSLAPRGLPDDSPVAAPSPTASPADLDRHSLEIFFVDRHPGDAWEGLFARFGARQRAAGMGEVVFSAAFVPTVPGTDRYVDEI